MFEEYSDAEDGELAVDPFSKDVELAKAIEEKIEYFQGPDYLSTVLSKPKKTPTFLKALEKFKKENEIQVSSLSSALNVLDMHKVSRASFTAQAATDLLGQLHLRLQKLGEQSQANPDSSKKLENFAAKIFSLHTQKEFRPLVLEVISSLPKIPTEYIDIISNSSEFYVECPVPVLRHIWLRHPRLLFDYIRPIMSSYYRARMYEPYNIDFSKINFFTSAPAKERRKSHQVKRLLEIVGQEFKLFKRILHWIRVNYEETGFDQLCTLRAELIMAAHDAGNEKFIKLDMAHEFAWCLDACMRDKNLDNHHAHKLKAILDLLQPLHYIIVLDVALVCADPHAMHFLLGLIVRKIRDNAANHLIREMHAVVLGMRILALGAHAEIIAKRKTVPERLFDTAIVTQFLSAFAGCMLEDHMFVEGLTDPETNEAAHPSLIPSVIIKYIKVDRLAALLYLHYVLDLLPMKGRTFNKHCLDRYALNLPLLNGSIAVEGLWGYLFIDRLIAVHAFSPFVQEDAFWKRHLMEELIIPALLMGRDPVVKFNHLRLIVAIGFCWGTVECMESFSRFHQLPLDEEALKQMPSYCSVMYEKAHKKVVNFLWRKDIMKPPLEDGFCKNGHPACTYHCPFPFHYGLGDEFAMRLDECYQGFVDPSYLLSNRNGKHYVDEDEFEDFFHLVKSE